MVSQVTWLWVDELTKIGPVAKTLAKQFKRLNRNMQVKQHRKNRINKKYIKRYGYILKEDE